MLSFSHSKSINLLITLAFSMMLLVACGPAAPSDDGETAVTQPPATPIEWQDVEESPTEAVEVATEAPTAVAPAANADASEDATDEAADTDSAEPTQEQAAANDGR